MWPGKTEPSTYELIQNAADIGVHLYEHPWSFLAAISWLVVSVGAGYACFSRRVKDTPIERAVWAALSLSAASRAFYVFERGIIPWDGIATAVCGALLVFCIAWKNRKGAKMGRRQSDRTHSPTCWGRRYGDCAPPDARKKTSSTE